MNTITNGQKLQNAYRACIEPYSAHLQIAVTLTLKSTARISVKRFENYGNERFNYLCHLDEERLQSTVRYFNALLTKSLFGNQAKHKNKKEWAKPLVFTIVEGRNCNKKTHLHLAIGNIPSEHLSNIEPIIKSAWARCDFANKQIKVKPLTNASGWLNYITKEVGYTDNDVLDICNSVIPQYIESSICT
jgi:hypothetical protein